MKAKLKLLKAGLLVIVIILDAYLLNLNISVNEYQISTQPRSTANYIKIDTTQEYINEESSDSSIIGMKKIFVSNILKKEFVESIEVEEVIVEEIVVEEDPIIYDGKTLEELANQLNKSLSSTITGKGELIASYSLEKGVDPYMATAIILHETGCKWGCSYLVRECNNVGGQKGSGCGAYSAFPSLDEGIMAFIDNLQRNYISYGLTTPEDINPKYAEDPNWSKNVNKYIETIKAL